MKTIIALATLAKRMAFPLFLLTAALVFVQPCLGQTGTWSSTGGLTTPRDSHTATLLADGTVVVAGGENETGVLTSAERYDPAAGTWSAIFGLLFPKVRTHGNSAT